MVDFPDSPAPVGSRSAIELEVRNCSVFVYFARMRQKSSPTEKKHLDLIALLHTVALELVLNLLVAGLALLLLRAHSTTHLGELVSVRTIMMGLLK